MKVFIFDLLAYGEQLGHLQVGSELPYPLVEPALQGRRGSSHLRRTS